MQPLGAILMEVLGCLVPWRYRSKEAALRDADIDPADFDDAVKNDAPLNRAALNRFVELIPAAGQRGEMKDRVTQAFLVRRASKQKSVSPVYSWSLRDLYHGRASVNPSIQGGRDYWDYLLARLAASSGLQSKPLDASNVSKWIVDLVDTPRRCSGEAIALTNASILLHAYLWRHSFSGEDRVPLLTLVFVTIDLASQLNDLFVLNAMLRLLTDTMRDRLGAVERDVCDRMINSCRASIVRHAKTFRPGSKQALDSHTFTLRSLESLHRGRKEFGFIADNPRLGLAWTSACFQAIQTAVAVGLSHAEIDEFIALHDETGTELKRLDAGFEPLDIKRAPVSANIYRSDMLGELYLHRPERYCSPHGPGESRIWRFDPDETLAITSKALLITDHTTKAADTALASLYLVHAEALLCRNAREYGRPTGWPQNKVHEYVHARNRAVDAFAALKMDWKLRRFAHLEGSSGVVAGEWEMKDFYRKTSRRH